MPNVQNFIYVGPSCPQKGLQQNKLYREETRPSGLTELIIENKYPLFGALYISTSYLGTFRKNLRTDPQSVESQAYKKLADIVRRMPR